MNVRIQTIEIFQSLRQKAEQLIQQQNAPSSPSAEMDIKRLAHELEVQYVELELQNEELRRSAQALELSRNAFAELYQSAPVAFVTINARGIIERVNTAAAKLLADPDVFLLGGTFYRYILPEDQAAYFAYAQKLALQAKAAPCELRLLGSGGRLLHAQIHASAKTDQAGGELNWHLAIVDLTGRKRIEESLQRLNETLEQQVAERTELAEARSRQLQSLAVEVIEAEERERQRIAELLHEDLQQILASARMQLQAASATAPPEPMIGNVEWLLEESIRKSRNLSHELSPPILHHSDLITALKALALQMAEQFGLFAEFKTEVQSPEVNPSIKTFFFRAVQELLFNVTKHAGVTKAQILLAGNKDTIAVTVSDDGQGFDPAILVTAGARSGLGLLSLRERASYIGGRLQIESAPGKGSRLTLTVPRNLVGRQASQFPTIEQQPHPRFKPPVRKSDSDIQVLFADDHKVMRQGLIKLISGKPDIHVVGEAANGREALELARQNRPDVIVMDVSMPDMDGIEATRRIKAELPQVRVIGLSMHEDEKLAQTMRQAGAENFVSKTASSSILLKAIYGI